MKNAVIFVLIASSIVMVAGHTWADNMPFCLFPNCFPVSMRTPDRQVDIQSYLGEWFEVARMPAPFQTQCICSQANYALNPKGFIDVHNSCIQRDGSSTEIDGYAYSKNDLNTQLTVYFNRFIGGAYWILDFDPDYQWAIVGEPCRKFGWILARTKTLEQDELEKRIKTLEDYGYETSKLIMRSTDC